MYLTENLLFDIIIITIIIIIIIIIHSFSDFTGSPIHFHKNLCGWLVQDYLQTRCHTLHPTDTTEVLKDYVA